MPRLVVTLPDASEQTFELNENQITIGRSEDNAIQIDHASVSGHHAQLTLEAGGYDLRDLGSTNGTRVDGEQIMHQRLEGGEQLRFGRVDAIYFSGKEGEGGSKPMPKAKTTSATISHQSVRPADFQAASGFKRHAKKKDPIGGLAIVLGLVAAAMLGFATFSVLGIQPPAF